MSPSITPRLVALVTHARTTPAQDRAAFSVAIEAFLANAGDTPALALTTCHRVELYVGQAAGVVPGGPAEADRGRGWSAVRAALPPRGQQLGERAAVRHLASVAVGLDSVILAEDQVLHQLRGSAAASERARGLAGPLARAVRDALSAGRAARSLRTGPPRSLADRALAVLLAQSHDRGAQGGRPLLVVGAGEMGRRSAAAARALGLPVTIASLHPAHADEVAASLGLTAWPLDPGPRIDEVRGVIVALRGPWALRSETAARLVAGAAPVVDLSFPPALDSNLIAALGARLTSADALASVGPEGDARLHRRLEALVAQAEAGYTGWIGRRAGAGMAQTLAEHAEDVRRRALERLWRQDPPFAPAERERIARMTRQLTDELLGPPLARLGRDGDGSGSRAARDLFDL